jgi:amidohydrolase
MGKTKERLKTDIREAVDDLAEELVAISKFIHSEPETCFQEVKASRRLAKALTNAGLDVTLPAFGLETSFVSEFGSPDGPCVGIIAEYDALPEIGHACGHNIIGTAAVGAALALAKVKDRLPGRVRLLGTPAEEGGGGKVLMARQGAFDGLACAMMVHPAPDDMPTFPLIARSAVTVTYVGRPSHASSEPEAGINALDGLVIAYQAIAAWRQHMPARHRIHGIITQGGVATNIIPDRACGQFVVRAPTRAGVEMLRKRVEECFRAGALASGAEVQIEWEDIDYYDLITNWPLSNAYRANAESLGRTFVSTDTLPPSHAASTDMGNVSHMVPSIHPMISSVPHGVAFHTREFAHWVGTDMGMRGVVDGAKALAMTAVDFLLDVKLQESVRRTFAQAIGERRDAPTSVLVEVQGAR